MCRPRRSDLGGKPLVTRLCLLVRELSGAELGSYGAKTTASPEDQRAWIRHACELKANYRRAGDANGTTQTAQVLNVSTNGIGLAVQPTLEAGALLNVELLDKTGRMVRTILGVRRPHNSTPQRGHYGCRLQFHS